MSVQAPEWTDSQLKLFGIQMAHGKYFHSDMLPGPDILGQVFLPLTLMKSDERQSMMDAGIVAVFEDYSLALPRAMNGFPCFSSCRLLTKEQNEKVLQAFKEEHERIKELRDEKEKEKEQGNGQ